MGVGGGGGAEAVDVGQRGAMWGWDALSQGGAQELHAVPPSTAPPQPAALRFLTFGVLYQGGGLAPFPTQQHSPPPTAAAPNAFAVDRGAQTHTRTHTQGSAPRPPRPSRCPPRHQTPPFIQSLMPIRFNFKFINVLFFNMRCLQYPAEAVQSYCVLSLSRAFTF